MSFSSSRSSTVRLASTPSFLFNNLACLGDSPAAYAHKDAVVLVSAANVASCLAPAASRLALKGDSGAIMHLCWLAASAERLLLAVCTRHDFALYASPSDRLQRSSAPEGGPCFYAALSALDASILRSRSPAAHFFRGSAAAAGLVFAGSSWGDVLAWPLSSRSGREAQSSSSLPRLLSGAHAVPITALAAEGR